MGEFRFTTPVAVAFAAVGLLLSTGRGARAQDMEPRAYSAVPIDTNFLIGGYTRITGSLSFDESLPITDVQAKINNGVLGYQRSFDLLGRTASVGMVVPYYKGNLTGKLIGEDKEISRWGFGDVISRLTINLLGNPSLTPEEFERREPTTTLGVSFAVAAPTGNYNPTQLINISAHRWGFKPEIGVSQPIGRWFADASAGVWLFTENRDFFPNHSRRQDPIETIQAHVGYDFAPGLWLAADGTYYWGGETSLDGVPGENKQAVTRVGLTLSVPIAEGLTTKFAWTTWLTHHNGGTFDVIGVFFQYRWF